MRNMRSILTSILIISMLVLFTGPATAATQGELTDLLKQLEIKEKELYSPEFAYDGLLQQLWRFDGFGGWFRKNLFARSAYKRLNDDLDQKKGTVDRITRELSDLRRKIQGKIYDIAFSFEESGQYGEAIKWYLKLESITDKIKFRIATCYKEDGQYAQAIQWFFDVDDKDDHVKYGIAESYELWGKHKDSTAWFFKVCNSFRDSDIERKALGKLETVDYPEKMQDYPDFYRRVSDIYIAKVFLFHSSDHQVSREAYQQASLNYARHLDTDSEKEASRSIVGRYRQFYRKAQIVLEEQEERAEQHYEEKLWKARRRYERAKDEYEVELKEAKNEYSRELNELFYKYRDFDDKYERYKSEGRSQEEIDSAKRWRDYYQREHANLNSYHACEKFIEDYVEEEKERMERAEDKYREITYRREEIIRDYLEPYTKKLEEARKTFDVIRDLHDEIYG